MLLLTALAIAIAPTPLGFPAREIPGTYYEGDHLGSNNVLTIKKEGGFTYTLSGCMGEYDRAAGSWALSGDVLTLRLTEPAKRPQTSAELSKTRFIPVKWGQRLLLVKEHEVPGFAATARAFASAPKWEKEMSEMGTLDYTKVDGKWEHATRFGTPILPERYRVFYQKGAVVAQVVRLGPGREVVLNRGRGSGLRKGLSLASGFWSPEVEILSVGEKSSVGRVWYSWGTTAPLKVGDKLTTGGEFVRPDGPAATLYASLEEANRKSP